MALLVTKENRPVFVTAEQAKLLWFVKTGERVGTPTTRRKAQQVAKWYLNRRTAPPSYLRAYPQSTYTSYKALAIQPRLPYAD